MKSDGRSTVGWSSQLALHTSLFSTIWLLLIYPFGFSTAVCSFAVKLRFAKIQSQRAYVMYSSTSLFIYSFYPSTAPACIYISNRKTKKRGRHSNPTSNLNYINIRKLGMIKVEKTAIFIISYNLNAHICSFSCFELLKLKEATEVYTTQRR